MEKSKSLKKIIIQGIVVISLLLALFSINAVAEELSAWELHVNFINAIRNREGVEVIKSYLDQGADPNLVDGGRGYSLKEAALVNSEKEVVKLLLDYGAKPNYSDLGRFIIYGCNLDIIRILLDQDVDVNKKISSTTIVGPMTLFDEDSIAREAEKNNLQEDLARTLLDSNYKTPLQIAIEANRKKLAELLLNYGAASTEAFSEYSKDSFVIISNDLTKLLVVKKDSVDASYWDIEGKEDPILIKEKILPVYSPEKAYVQGNAVHLQNKNTLENISAGNVYTHSYHARIEGNAVHINRVEDNTFVNKIELPDLFASGKWDPVIEISNDNSKIAVFMRYNGYEQEYRNKNYFYLYDINSGEKIDEIKVFGDSDSITNDPHMMDSFSFDDRYITIQYSKNSALHTNIYSLEKGRYVFNDKNDYGGNDGVKRYYFLKEKDLLWIKNIDKKHIEIVDLSKGISGEIIKSFNYYSIDGFPRMETDFLGSTYDGNTFNELIVMEDQLVKFKTHQIEDEEIKKIAYNKEKEEWVLVGQNKVHYISTDADEARESFEQYAEGLELLEIGFEEGIDRIKETLAEVPSTALAQNNGRFLNPDYDLSLKERAELVLAEYNCLMACDSRSIIGIDFEFIMSPMGYKIISIDDNSDLNRYPEIEKGAVITAVNGKAIIPDKDLTDYYSHLEPGKSITLTINQDGMDNDYEIKLAGDMLDNYDLLYAHRKLFEYGLLAARAGYPQFTLQAAELLRELKANYPNDLLWAKVENHIVLLEALGIAVRDGSKAGYKHMLNNDGILNDDDNQNYILNVYFNDYPEYFAPLLADRKKMAYFTKISENELPSVQLWELEKVDFIDLEGNEIAGVDGRMGDSNADGAAGENSSSESDDLNSEDSNSGNSGAAGTVLD